MSMLSQVNINLLDQIYQPLRFILSDVNELLLTTSRDIFSTDIYPVERETNIWVKKEVDFDQSPIHTGNKTCELLQEFELNMEKNIVAVEVYIRVYPPLLPRNGHPLPTLSNFNWNMDHQRQCLSFPILGNIAVTDVC